MTPELLAQRFHEEYERLAPSFGYQTRKESAKPWAEVPARNKALMIAVCKELLDDPTIAEALEQERREQRTANIVSGSIPRPSSERATGEE